MNITTKPYKKFPTMHAVFINDEKIANFRDKGDDIWIMKDTKYFEPRKTPPQFIPKQTLNSFIRREMLKPQLDRLGFLREVENVGAY